MSGVERLREVLARGRKQQERSPHIKAAFVPFEDIEAVLAIVEAAQKVTERGEERLIGTRLYTIPWADVHNLELALDALVQKSQEDSEAEEAR